MSTVKEPLGPGTFGQSKQSPRVGAPPVYRPNNSLPPAPTVQLQRHIASNAPPVYRPNAVLPAAPAVYRPHASVQQSPAPPIRPAVVLNHSPGFFPQPVPVSPVQQLPLTIQMRKGARRGQKQKRNIEERGPLVAPLPGRRQRLIAENEQELAENLRQIEARIEEQERIREEQRIQLQEDKWFRENRRNRLQELRQIRATTQIGTAQGPLAMLDIRHFSRGPLLSNISDQDSEIADDILELIEALPIPGILDIEWLYTTGATFRSFVLRHTADLNVANFRGIVTLCCRAYWTVHSVAEAQQVFNLNLPGTTADEWVDLLTKYAQIPSIPALTLICNSGQFASYTELRRCLRPGGDVYANKWLLALGLSQTQVKAFAERTGTNQRTCQQRLTNTVIPLGHDYTMLDLITIWLEVENASTTALFCLVENYVQLQDKTTITTDTVGTLVRARLLVPICSGTYDTGYGKGQTFIFCFPNQRKRIPPEWHVHFQASGGKKAATVSGAGWKYQSEKKTRGAKIFGSAGTLPEALGSVKKWFPPII